MSIFSKNQPEKTYEIKVNCSNCRKIYTINIPIGISVDDNLKGKKCIFCDLPYLKQSISFFDNFPNKELFEELE